MPRVVIVKEGMKRRKNSSKGKSISGPRSKPQAKPRSKAMNSLSKVFSGYTQQAPFPPFKNYKLKYTHTVTLSSTTAGVMGSQQVFRLNGMYDVDVTGGGHQPYGFDQLASIYKRYKVNAVAVKILISNPSSDGLYVAGQIANPSNSSEFINTLTADIVQERQQAFVQRINNSGSQLITKKFYLPIYKGAGIHKIQFLADPDNYTASVSGNPGSEVKLLLACGSDHGDSGESVTVSVEFTFYALMYQRVQLSQS